jgi:Asp-tRNA(Asn)/Glu-tRNA(Gln) amidotransferase A subunit family amidase
MDLADLGAAQLARMIDGGEITSSDLIEACLSRIDACEDEVRAWTHLDRDFAREQADRADEQRQRGLPLGPLHGVPVGVKDIFDTADYPTEYGTPLHEGRTPAKDCTVVARLREAGAIILGKTVTTELAVYSPGKTSNPHDATRTPGGSSSGSAAAVASFMVPLAVGSQTNGSIIRPASFCGAFGYKPTHGLISRYRVLKQSRPLDTVGVFARSLEDLALIAEPLMAYDDRDPDMRPRAAPYISRIMAEEPPVEPHIAFVRSPVWGQAEETTKDAMRELVERVGKRVEIVDLPPTFDEAHDTHRKIMEADLAVSFAGEYKDGKGRLSAVLCEMIERGQKVLAMEYNAAIARAGAFNEELDEIFGEYDAILTPSAAGEAPVGLESTGSPEFCTIWTLCGVPALNLPVLQGPNDMPLGAQLTGQRGDDARLFRTARWLLSKLEE